MSHTKENGHKSERVKTIIKKGGHIQLWTRIGHYSILQNVGLK